ncbi:MAG: hypothetical protein AAF389_00035 [Gemmatimonadota bacterium]
MRVFERSRPLLCGLALAALAGCELEEITIVEVEDVVIVEVFVDLMPDPADNEVIAFVHQTVGQSDPAIDDLDDARITIFRSTDALTLELTNESLDQCVETSPETQPGACFTADDVEVQQLRPGDILELRVELADGGLIEGATRVPGAFGLAGTAAACRIPPDKNIELEWTRSEGAWAYLNETSIRGLPTLLAEEGIQMNDDPLYLLGLSISAADTTIVYPSEFGVFNRLDLQTDVATRLQRGIPNNATAQVTIRAVDRNYVNWARGGNFNPSGQIRVPSVTGDGTGVFGSTYGYSIQTLVIDDPRTGLPDC